MSGSSARIIEDWKNEDLTDGEQKDTAERPSNPAGYIRIVPDFTRRGDEVRAESVSCYTTECYTSACYTSACYTSACYTTACYSTSC